MKSISAFLENIIKILLIVIVAVLVSSTALQVVSRFILKSPIIWTEEVTRMSFIWMSLLGAALATKYKEHLGLDLLTDKLTGAIKKALQIAIHTGMIGVVIILIVAGWIFVEKNLGRTSVTTGMPMYYLYISAPISGLFMLFYLIEQIPSLLKDGDK